MITRMVEGSQDENEAMNAAMDAWDESVETGERREDRAEAQESEAEFLQRSFKQIEEEYGMEPGSAREAARAAGIEGEGSPLEAEAAFEPGTREALEHETTGLAPEVQEKINTWFAENGARITQRLEAFEGYEGLWRIVLDELRVSIPGTGEEIVVTPDGAGGATYAPYKQVKEVFDEYVQFGFLTDKDIAKVPGLLGTTLRRVTPGGAGAEEAPEHSRGADPVESTPASAEAVPEIIDLYHPPKDLTLTQFLAAIESGHLKGFSAGHAGELGIRSEFRRDLQAMFPGGVVTDEGLAQLEGSWIMRGGNHYTNGGFFQSLVAHERADRERGTAGHEDHEPIESDGAHEPGPAVEPVGTTGEGGDEPKEKAIAAGEAEVADGNADIMTGEVAHEGAPDAEAETTPNPHERIDALPLPTSAAGAEFMAHLPTGEAGPAQTAQQAAERIEGWTSDYRDELERVLKIGEPDSVHYLERSMLLSALNGEAEADRERTQAIRNKVYDTTVQNLESYFDREEAAPQLFTPESALDDLALVDPSLLREMREVHPALLNKSRERLEERLRDPEVLKRDTQYAVSLAAKYRRLFGEPPEDRVTTDVELASWDQFTQDVGRTEDGNYTPFEELSYEKRQNAEHAAFTLAMQHSERLQDDPDLKDQVVSILRSRARQVIDNKGHSSFTAGKAITHHTKLGRALRAVNATA